MWKEMLLAKANKKGKSAVAQGLATQKAFSWEKGMMKINRHCLSNLGEQWRKI